VRLFVALNFPASVRHGLWQAAAPLRDRGFPLRWVASDSIHLTVKFLGEVLPEQLPGVQAALGPAAVGTRSLVLTVTGFGVFPPEGVPRVVWAGLDAGPALELLHHATERAFAPLGFPLEGRPFQPHVTLGRSARTTPTARFQGLADALAALRYETTVHVESIELMESVPAGRGVTYHVRHSERLS
jgi:2'-5' RNA ligase